MGHRARHQASLEAAAHIQSRWIHQGSFISLRQDTIDYPDGHRQTWDIVMHPGAVAIAPLTPNGEIILVEQFRRAIGRITLEIPAGLMERGEAPESCAQRELQEEIGYRAQTLTPLGTYYSSPGILTEKTHLFLAQDLKQSELVAEDTHQIDVCTISLQQALEWVEGGIICDAKTALAILKVGPLCSVS